MMPGVTVDVSAALQAAFPDGVIRLPYGELKLPPGGWPWGWIDQKRSGAVDLEFPGPGQPTLTFGGRWLRLKLKVTGATVKPDLTGLTLRIQHAPDLTINLR